VKSCQKNQEKGIFVGFKRKILSIFIGPSDIFGIHRQTKTEDPGLSCDASLREPTKKPKVPPQKAVLDKNASSPTRRIPLQSPLVSIGSHPQEVNFKKETTRFTIHQATHQT